MWDDQVMATPLNVQNMSTRQAFINGRVAMVEDGSWALKDILAGANFRVGVTLFPAGPVRRVTLATTDGFGIYAGTKHPDAAWELLSSSSALIQAIRRVYPLLIRSFLNPLFYPRGVSTTGQGRRHRGLRGWPRQWLLGDGRDLCQYGRGPTLG